MIIKKESTNFKKLAIMDINEYLINDKFSASVISINGNHKTIKSIEDRIYFVLEGDGKFIIDGKEDIVKKEDLIFIEKNTPYNIIGRMKYLLIHSPKFDSSNDTFLE